jgi:hypothetical protein
MPEWKERHAADVGIALVEALAYTGDYLSYYQDAVATEAYLGTARQRISVRRHAQLVDYTLHEGCNARAWVTLWVSEDLPGLLPDDFYLVTDPGLSTGGTVLEERDLPATLPRPYLVFAPLVEDRRMPLTLRTAHNEIRLYTWGDAQCCLAAGATAATLLDPGKAAPPAEGPAPSPAPPPAPAADGGYQLDLHVGDVVVVEEVKGPKTGTAADADPEHRHAVRLTRVTRAVDPLTHALVVEIEWAAEDALPFPVCISSVGPGPECEPITDVSVVRGNVVLVDEGEHVEEDLPPVPTVTVPPGCCDPCAPREVVRRPGWYRPTLRRPDVTFGESLLAPRPARAGAPAAPPTPAAALLRQDIRRALPQVRLYGIPALPGGDPAFTSDNLSDPAPLLAELAAGVSARSVFLRGWLSATTLAQLAAWVAPAPPELRAALLEDLQSIWRGEPRRDLLASGADDRHFVVEIDDRRQAHLRFGDGELGRSPEAGMTFHAVYRVGSGPAGNVGAGAIAHIVFRTTRPGGVTVRPRNPRPAVGGTAPEPIAEAKLFAPRAFRKTLERAIVAADYAELAGEETGVQRAAAVLRWTGSWYEADVSVDPLGREDVDAAMLRHLTWSLRRYRRMGHDLRVGAARYVPLRIVMSVCVLPHYLRGHVEAALLDVFSNRVLPDGRPGFFRPDTRSFGEAIYLSCLVAAAQAVTGVESVQVTTLERLFEGPNGEIESGVLPLGPLEIGQLDNDPSFPEHGILTLVMGGGR